MDTNETNEKNGTNGTNELLMRPTGMGRSLQLQCLRDIGPRRRFRIAMETVDQENLKTEKVGDFNDVDSCIGAIDGFVATHDDYSSSSEPFKYRREERSLYVDFGDPLHVACIFRLN